MKALLRLAMILVATAGLVAGQDTPPPAKDQPPAVPHESTAGKRRAGSSIRRTAGARNGKPRKIKMQKMKGVPKFKKPRRS